MVNHYLLRVGDGKNFTNSSNLSIWAVKSRYKTFLKNIRTGDKLWFIKKKDKNDIHVGKIIAVADFVSKNKRETGPLLSITPTNDELKWDKKGDLYNVEIHYTNLYNLTECKLFTGLSCQSTVVNYDNIRESLLINLIIEYENIKKYSKITTYM